MILCWLSRWVAKPIAMQIPEMVQCPLLRVCTICGEGLPSSRAVFDGHWAFPWGVEGELIPGKTRGPLEVGVPRCPLFALLHTLLLPIHPVPWGDACAMAAVSQLFCAFDGLFVHIFSGLTSSMCVQCRAGFFSLCGASCWKCACPNAARIEQHQHPLCFISRGIVSVCSS